MKSRNLLLTLTVSLFTLTLFAQSSIGIPVQGIARDSEGAARINQQIILTLELYYIEGGNEVPLYSPAQVENLTTDGFGVFSSIVNTAGRRSVFGSKEIFLRIKEGGNTISDELLNSVPYAIAADNGVPTGAIMPYIGSTAPEGWLLCDGSPLPTGQDYDALKAFLDAIPDLPNFPGETRVPDLRGMFVRGAGNNSQISTQNAPLGFYFGDTFESHNHGHNISVSGAGNHHHLLPLASSATNYDSGGNAAPAIYRPNSLSNLATQGDNQTNTGAQGGHTHSISGGISTNGSSETRPDHYGLNYIIKL